MGNVTHSAVCDVPIAASSAAPTANPIAVPSSARSAVAPVAPALVRSTESVPRTTQKPCCTLVRSATATAAARASAPRRLLTNHTERRLAWRAARANSSRPSPRRPNVTPPRCRTSGDERRRRTPGPRARRRSERLRPPRAPPSRSCSRERRCASGTRTPPGRGELADLGEAVAAQRVQPVEVRRHGRAHEHFARAAQHLRGGSISSRSLVVRHPQVAPLGDEIADQRRAPLQQLHRVRPRLVAQARPIGRSGVALNAFKSSALASMIRLGETRSRLAAEDGIEFVGECRGHVRHRGAQPRASRPEREVPAPRSCPTIETSHQPASRSGITAAVPGEAAGRT